MAGKKGRSGTNGRGKTAPKRTPVARELDKAKMMEMLRRGYTQTHIAEVLGIHKTMVNYDFKAVMTEVRAGVKENAQGYIDQRLVEYAEVKSQAWESWERSKQRKVVDKETGGVSFINVAGNPEFLDRVLETIAAERQLLGLDPVKTTKVEGNLTQTTLTLDMVLGLQPLLVNGVPDEAEARIKALMGHAEPPPEKDSDTLTGAILNGSQEVLINGRTEQVEG